eukprot:TRINITY_DN754_c0_g1_i1.p1 TRINITY_DN754_c0_g1~~TRINITY_DN754_c0_g1_i1.p1  ORF type:complete len:289 (+),score=73.42 TRINITY_DN754_c0_g1_i1:110-868(+)
MISSIRCVGINRMSSVFVRQIPSSYVMALGGARRYYSGKKDHKDHGVIDPAKPKETFRHLFNQIDLAHSSVVQEIVDVIGPQINKATDHGDTPLIHLLKISNTDGDKHVNVLKALLSSPHIDPNKPHHLTYSTPLHHIVSKNAYNNPGGNNLQPALVVHSNDAHLRMIELLLEHGANPNLTNRNQDAPLHIAADHGDIAAIKTLLAHRSIDPGILDAHSQSPADRATKAGHVTVSQLLKKAEAERDKREDQD